MDLAGLSSPLSLLVLSSGVMLPCEGLNLLEKPFALESSPPPVLLFTLSPFCSRVEAPGGCPSRRGEPVSSTLCPLVSSSSSSSERGDTMTVCGLEEDLQDPLPRPPPGSASRASRREFPAASPPPAARRRLALGPVQGVGSPGLGQASSAESLSLFSRFKPTLLLVAIFRDLLSMVKAGT